MWKKYSSIVGILVIFQLTRTIAVSQDSTVYYDNKGKRIKYIAKNFGNGYVLVRIHASRTANDYGIFVDSLDTSNYIALGDKVLGEFSAVLRVGVKNFKFVGLVHDNRDIIYRQTYGGIAVFETEVRIKRREQSDKRIFEIQGEILPGIHCDTVPLLDSDDAILSVRKYEYLKDAKLGTPRLTILPRIVEGKRTDYLAWFIPISGMSHPGCFINAIDSTLIWMMQNLN